MRLRIYLEEDSARARSTPAGHQPGHHPPADPLRSAGARLGRGAGAVQAAADNFVHGREFLGDEHLNAERERWQEHTANVRLHATVKERPRERFERDERHVRQPLAERGYRSLILLPPKRVAAPQPPAVPATAEVHVERRPLAAYAALAAGAA